MAYDEGEVQKEARQDRERSILAMEGIRRALERMNDDNGIVNNDNHVLAAKDKRIAELEKSVEILNTETHRMLDTAEARTKTIVHMRTKIAELEEKNRSLRKDKQISEQRKSLDDMEIDVDNLQKTLAGKTATIAELKIRIHDLENGDMVCRACKGRGTMGDESHRQFCKACDGTGRAS